MFHSLQYFTKYLIKLYLNLCSSIITVKRKSQEFHFGRKPVVDDETTAKLYQRLIR